MFNDHCMCGCLVKLVIVASIVKLLQESLHTFKGNWTVDILLAYFGSVPTVDSDSSSWLTEVEPSVVCCCCSPSTSRFGMLCILR